MRIDKNMLDMQDTSELLHALINASPDIVCFKNGRGQWLLANTAILQLFELGGVHYQGKTNLELAAHSIFFHEALQVCEQTDEATWGNRSVTRRDEVVLCPDGRRKIFDVIKVPHFYEDGSRKWLVILGRDISERVQAEEELQTELEERKKANIALNVLLEQFRHVGKEAEQRVSGHFRAFILPWMDHLKSIIRDEKARECLGIIEDRLSAMTDKPHTETLQSDMSSLRLSTLNSKEMLIADLIAKGKSTGDIAQTLNLSRRTIDVYRLKIRKKLGLTHKKIQLDEYLRNSLFP